jgi:pyruvate-formate lyase-activating enzyme
MAVMAKQPKQCMFLNYNYFIPGANINGNHFRACCVTREKKFITTGSLSEDHKHCLDYVNTRRTELANGFLGNCVGCQFLVDGAGMDKQQFSFILNTGLPGGSRCNAACIYCDSLENKNQDKCSYSVLDIFKYVRDNIDPKTVYMSYASAEITLSEFHDELLDIWLETGWRGIVFTSGIKYSESLARLLHTTNGVSLNISLDCGTKDTYKQVKRRDKFAAVISTLRKYPNDKLELKYNLLQNHNTNEHEIECFLDLCVDINPKFICLSNNQNEKYYSEEKLVMAKFFITQAFLRGIRQVNLSLDYFDNFTLQQIKNFALNGSYPKGFVKYEYR